VIENHTSGGSILLGDECGRLTAIGWEFDGAESVRVGKIDLGAVS
jgi:DNA damage-binding protein 1